MMKYYTRELTPLKFHKLYHWIITPLNILNIIVMTLQMFANHQFSWLSMVYNGLLFIACIMTFYGCFKFKKYAWWAIIGGFALELVYDIYFVAYYAVTAPEYTMMAFNQVCWRFVVVIIMGAYYWKRKPLFFNPVPLEDIPEEYRSLSKKQKKQSKYR